MQQRHKKALTDSEGSLDEMPERAGWAGAEISRTGYQSKWRKAFTSLWVRENISTALTALTTFCANLSLTVRDKCSDA